MPAFLVPWIAKLVALWGAWWFKAALLGATIVAVIIWDQGRLSNARKAGIEHERSRAREQLDHELVEVKKDVQRHKVMPEDELDRRFRCIRERVHTGTTSPDCNR